MRYVLAIVGVCVVLGFFISRLDSKHDQSDVEHELDRISSEMDNIASLLENPDNKEANRASAINLLRYQSGTIDEFLSPKKPTAEYVNEKLDWSPQLAVRRQQRPDPRSQSKP